MVAGGAAKRRKTAAATTTTVDRGDHDEDRQSPKRAVGKKAAAPKLSAAALARHDSSQTAASSASSGCGKKGACCASCGQSRSDGGGVPGVKDACSVCFEVYHQGFTMHGSWSDFVSKKANDEGLQETFAAARKFKQSGGRGAWAPELVSSGSLVSLEVCQPMCAPTRAQLVQLLGCTPEECGARLMDLTDGENRTFKGLLMPNPFRPFLEYNFTWRTGVERSQEDMPPAGQLYSAQGRESFEFLRKNFCGDAQVEKVLSKFKTRPWDMESLLDKATDVRNKKGQGPPPGLGALLGDTSAGRSSAASSMPAPKAPAAQEGPSGSEQGDEDEDDAASVAVTLGPALNQRAVAQSIGSSETLGSCKSLGRGGGAPSECGSRRAVAWQLQRQSPGAKTVRWMQDGGVPTSDDGKQDLVDRRIASASVSRILGGASMGREIRWAKESRDTFMANNEDKFANMLDSHVRLCEQAEVLASSSILKMPAGRLLAAVKELQDACEELPTRMKLLLYKRHIVYLQGTFGDGPFADELITSSLPWLPQCMVDLPREFDGTKPRLSVLESSPGDRSLAFEEAICGVLGNLVREGAKSQAALLRFCDRIIGRLEEEAESDESEDFDAAVTSILMVAQSFKALADPLCVRMHASVQAFHDLGARKDKITKARPLYAVYLAMKSSEHWWQISEEFDNTKAATLETQGLIPEWIAGLGGDGDDAVDLDVLTEALGKLPDLTTSLRKGATAELEEAVTRRLRQHLNSFDWESAASSGDVVSALQPTKKALDLAMQCLHTHRGEWTGALRRAEQLQDKCKREKAFETLKGLVEGCSKDDLADAVKRGELLVAIRGASDIAGLPGEDIVVRIEKVAGCASQYLEQDCGKPEDAEPVLDMIDDFLRVEGFSPDQREKMSAQVQTCRTWKGLAASYAEFMELGEDVESRLADPTSAAKVSACLSGLSAASACEGIEQSCRRLAQFVEEVKATIDEVRVARLKEVDDKVGELVEALKPDALGGSDGQCWSVGLASGLEKQPERFLDQCSKLLAAMQGASFAKTLQDLVQAEKTQADAYDMFGQSRDEAKAEETKVLVRQCTATKFVALLMHARTEHQKEPNAGRIRRLCKKYRQSIEASNAQEFVHPVVWEWSGKASSYSLSAALE